MLDFAVGAPVDKTSAAKGKKVRRVVNTAGGVVVIELFALTFLYLLTLTYCDHVIITCLTVHAAITCTCLLVYD